MAEDQFQYIKLPDGSYGKFASDATDDVIKGAIQKDFPDAFTPTPVQQAANRTGFLPNTSMSAGTQTFDQAHPNATPTTPGIMARFAAGAGIPASQSDTTQAVRGMLTPQADPNEQSTLTRGLEQVPILGGDFRARADLSKRADQEGGTGVGIAHRIASWIPLAGPAVTAAQDKYDQGDYAGAVGAGLTSLFSMEGLKGAVTPKPNVLPTDQTIQQVAARKPFTPPAPMPKALPASPIFTPPPADTSGSIPYTPPPFSNTTRAQRLGLMLPEKASGAIQLGPGEILPPSSPEGLFPAAPHFLVDGDGNPRVQFLTSAATDQLAAPNTAPDSAQSLFQNTPATKPNLLDGIREHDLISRFQNEMSAQDGDVAGQSSIDQWMQAHNQQAPGAKPGPGLMSPKSSKVLNSSIEQANAAGQSVLPPDDVPAQKSPGLMNKAKRPTPQAAQPQVATADNTEGLLRQTLLNKGIDPDTGQPIAKGPGLMNKAVQNNPSDIPAAPDDRRLAENAPERKRLDQMTEAEKDQELLTAPKTGLPNSRAFDESGLEQSHPHVGFADMDDFKSFNSAMGKKGVDTKVLPALGEMFRRAVAEEPEGTLHAYQQTAGSAGDEFLLRSKDPDTIKRVVGKINDQMANTTFKYEKPNGTIVEKKGTGLSHGIGTDPETAEAASAADKQARKAAGLRTGERDVSKVDSRSSPGKQAPGRDPSGRN